MIGVARIAAIQGAKRTAELIPLCHPLPITRVAVEFELDAAAIAVRCTAQVETLGRTGVEMEALTAVQVGLLTVYDMCKAADRGMVMGDIRLLREARRQVGRLGGRRLTTALARSAQEVAPAQRRCRRLRTGTAAAARRPRAASQARRSRRPAGCGTRAAAAPGGAPGPAAPARASASAQAIISRVSSR